MQTLAETLQTKNYQYPKKTIVSNLNKNYSNNSNYSRVNRLLEQYRDYIHQAYVGWFARRFHALSDAAIANAAELACTANNGQRYFASVIAKEYEKSTCNKDASAIL